MPRELENQPNGHPGEKLEAYLDGELSAAEAVDLARRLESSAELREELATARAVRQALRDLPPVDASAMTLARVRREVARRDAARRRARRWRPAMALAAGLAIAVVGLTMWRSLDRAAQPDAAEVARAAAEARWVFAQMDRLTRKAGATVREEVLEKYLVEPTRRGVQTSLGLSSEAGRQPVEIGGNHDDA